MPHGMMRFIAALLLALLSLNARAVEEVIYYHNDALGSPIAATDQEGRVVWRKSYTPYGQPIGPAAPNEPGYTGKFEEPDLGIQNFGARWYDPRIGRFLSTDPVGFDPQNPQSFNRYAYANNNPYKYVDPDGRAAETALDIISLGLSLTAFGNDPSLGNGLGLAYDALATAVPFLPAGFGIIKNAGNAAEAVGDAAKGADNAAWPPNRGFDGDSAPASLIPGAKVDRYGSPNGTFVSPDRTPFPNRSLPTSSASKPLKTYEVAKTIQVDAGSAAPWFNQPGEGTQFELPRTVQDLLDSGHLRQVK